MSLTELGENLPKFVDKQPFQKFDENFILNARNLQTFQASSTFFSSHINSKGFRDSFHYSIPSPTFTFPSIQIHKSN